MPHYWDNKALPTPTLSDTYFQLFDYFLNFIDNKCLSDVIWDLKREKKKKSLQKADSNSGQSHQKDYGTRFTNYATGSFVMLTSPITRWWAEV